MKKINNCSLIYSYIEITENIKRPSRTSLFLVKCSLKFFCLREERVAVQLQGFWNW